MVKLCDDFYNGTINFERINWVHIALITKKNTPQEVSDFRPISSKGIRLVAWKRIRRPKIMGVWGILDLKEFNHALLGKWWWKIIANPNSFWAKIINANYNIFNHPGTLYHSAPRNKSFFLGWNSRLLTRFSFMPF